MQIQREVRCAVAAVVGPEGHWAEQEVQGPVCVCVGAQVLKCLCVCLGVYIFMYAFCVYVAQAVNQPSH